jgi:hypothetical protein
LGAAKAIKSTISPKIWTATAYKHFLIVPFKAVMRQFSASSRSKIRSTICPDRRKIVSANGHRAGIEHWLFSGIFSPPYGSPIKRDLYRRAHHRRSMKKICEKCLSGWLHLDYRGEQSTNFLFIL